MSEEVHATKYRAIGETFKEAMTRVADGLKDSAAHFDAFRPILYDMRFMPAGRIQAAIGSPKEVTPYNCFVSGTIDDSMDDIMDKLKEAATTLRLGGGIGYDFSSLRPSGARIRSLDSDSSGPLSFMDVYNSLCGTISSAGHRRGAQMGVLRVDHPDIEAFVTAKNNETALTNFNISVAVTDEFMQAVEADTTFDLVFEGRVYRTIRATALWDKILRSTWEWAEPGVLFIDTMNKKNNLHYCETIAATNPCGEQPLPPYGACLLGSFNLAKYIEEDTRRFFNTSQFMADIPIVVRAMDNVVDRAVYPLPAQEEEAKNKRRMGLGVTGLANAAEALGYPYGSSGFLDFTKQILTILRDYSYIASIELAKEKGSFPLYTPEYLNSEFIQTLPREIQQLIERDGIRNSHLLSIAPTGTISLSADNVSSGLEPVFRKEYERDIRLTSGTAATQVIQDYGYRVFGVEPRNADEVTVQEHVAVLNLASSLVDSACSKTCNVGADVSWEDFKEVYMTAWKGGSSGCTTFRASGGRAGILRANKDEDLVEVDAEGAACYIDPHTMIRSCE
jgi:ribonucleoside-diphosphate reductase alpha chain